MFTVADFPLCIAELRGSILALPAGRVVAPDILSHRVFPSIVPSSTSSMPAPMAPPPVPKQSARVSQEQGQNITDAHVRDLEQKRNNRMPMNRSSTMPCSRPSSRLYGGAVLPPPVSSHTVNPTAIQNKALRGQFSLEISPHNKNTRNGRERESRRGVGNKANQQTTQLLFTQKKPHLDEVCINTLATRSFAGAMNIS